MSEGKSEWMQWNERHGTALTHPSAIRDAYLDAKHSEEFVALLAACKAAKEAITPLVCEASLSGEWMPIDKSYTLLTTAINLAEKGAGNGK